MSILEKLEAARAKGDLQVLLDAVPYARFLGLSVERGGGDRLITKLRYDPSLIGNPAIPALHGGTIGALLESAAIFQLLDEAETASLPKTITLTIDYLRSARTVDTFAEGKITRHGRRVASVYATAWQEDRERPVASAMVHLLLKPGTT